MYNTAEIIEAIAVNARPGDLRVVQALGCTSVAAAAAVHAWLPGLRLRWREAAMRVCRALRAHTVIYNAMGGHYALRIVKGCIVYGAPTQEVLFGEFNAPMTLYVTHVMIWSKSRLPAGTTLQFAPCIRYMMSTRSTDARGTVHMFRVPTPVYFRGFSMLTAMMDTHLDINDDVVISARVLCQH